MRRRLVVNALVLVAAVLLAFAVPLGIAVRSLLENRALDEMQVSVEGFGVLLDRTARDCEELRFRVAQLGDLPAVYTVIGDGGLVLATTRPDARVLVGDELADAVQGRVGRRLDRGRLAVAAPWSTTACPQVAWIHATQPDAELAAAVWRSWSGIALVAGVVAAVAAGSAWWLSRRLTSPLETLRDSARRLGDGDFSARADRSGLPEVDAIAEALDGTAERLGRAVERAAVFTEDASHQLRTPLTALRLQVESLQGIDPDALQAVLAEADRLEATVDDLVALTRVDGPELEVDVGVLVGAQLPSWRAVAADRGRELLDELQQVPALRVRPAAVAQALHVLLDNALTHGEGRVTVRVAPVGRTAVEISVTDEGPGVTAVTERPDRRGLGLARALIAGEGGQVVHRAEGPGTRACVLLPVRGDTGVRHLHDGEGKLK